MTVYVGSLEYSPVFKSHCCAFGNECERQGYAHTIPELSEKHGSYFVQYANKPYICMLGRKARSLAERRSWDNITDEFEIF